MEKNYGNKLDITKALKETDKCIELLKKQFEYVGFLNKPETGFWVLEDGTVLNCNAHGNADLFLIKEGYIKNCDRKFDIFDGSQFLDKINAVRIRNEITKWRTPAYLTLPLEKMSPIQQRITFKWIEDILFSTTTFLIVDTGFKAKRYQRFEDEKAIEDIKFYYRTGNFE